MTTGASSTPPRPDTPHPPQQQQPTPEIPGKPKAAFQWPPNCLWPFTELSDTMNGKAMPNIGLDTATLQLVRMPRLALFGALDKNVEPADGAARSCTAFNQAGLKDVTMVTFSAAGHTLERSMTGYEGDPSLPERMLEGYPEATIYWRDAR